MFNKTVVKYLGKAKYDLNDDITYIALIIKKTRR